MQTETRANNTPSLSLLTSAKLKRVEADVEIFGMAELFESLMCSRVSAKQVNHRVAAFASFINSKKVEGVPSWLETLARQLVALPQTPNTDLSSFYNTSFFSVAAYLFKVRLVLYYERNGGLAAQYFGSVKFPKIRAFSTGSSYFLVGKICDRKPAGLRAKRISIHQLKTQDNSPRFPTCHPLNRKSLTTIAPLDFDMNICPDDDCDDQDSRAPRISNFLSNSSLSAELFENTTKSTRLSDPQIETNCTLDDNSTQTKEELNKQAINQLLCFTSNGSQPKASPDSATPVYIPPTFKDKILFESSEFSIGRLKFYNEQKGFGFIVSSDSKDVFVHKDDLLRANINTCQLEYTRGFYDIVLKYRYIEYKGKMKNNNKAIDIHVVEVNSLV